MTTRRFDYLEAARRYAAGESTPSIGKALGVSARSVYMALKQQDVALRNIGDAVSLAKRGRKHISNGYVRVANERGARTPEHILIAEAALGRKLRRGECVHHVNCDRADNRRENLLVCSAGYHIALHWRMRKHPYWRELQKGNRYVR